MKSILTFIIMLIFLQSYSQEICNNGIDDDLDGLIDLNDTTNCNCTIGVLPPIIPNPSFENFSNCPTAISQMTRVNFWMDALAYNSPDYYNCGFRLPAMTFPFPHGNGVIGFAVGNGNSKEYFGTCLLDTLKQGITYRLQFDYSQFASFTPRPIAIFGSENCANIPYPRTPLGGSGTTVNCPSFDTNWVTLDTLIPLINTNTWNTYNFEFTPTSNITTIIIGPSCALLSSPSSQAFYGTIDNLKLSAISPTVTISDSGHICNNDLTLRANYDSIPNSFQWYKNGIALVNDTNSVLPVFPYGVGSYQVLLEFNKGCLLSEFFVVDTPTIQFDIDSIGTCLNTSDGSIIINNVSGGTNPYSYSINSSIPKIDSSFNNLSYGTYSITVTDSNLCSSTKLSTIIGYPLPESSFVSDTVCLGNPTSFWDRSSISTGIITNWKWENPINSITQNTIFTFSNSGVIPITLTLTSDSGCINDTTIDVIINPLPIIDFSFEPSKIFTYNTNVCFTNTSVGAINYFWNFGFSGTTSTITSPCPISFPNKSGTYNVKLIGINQFGCIDSIIKTITIEDDFIVYVPNSFTPNNDNINDEISVVHLGVTELEWMIFNRWGEEIFKTKDLNNSWDGFHNGELSPIGIYPYILTITSISGDRKEFIGQINLLK